MLINIKLIPNILTKTAKKYIIATDVVMRWRMKVLSIKNVKMTIPSDINKMLLSNKKNEYCPSFGQYNLKPIAIPISDSFVHILH